MLASSLFDTTSYLDMVLTISITNTLQWPYNKFLYNVIYNLYLLYEL